MAPSTPLSGLLMIWIHHCRFSSVWRRFQHSDRNNSNNIISNLELSSSKIHCWLSIISSDLDFWRMFAPNGKTTTWRPVLENVHRFFLLLSYTEIFRTQARSLHCLALSLTYLLKYSLMQEIFHTFYMDLSRFLLGFVKVVTLLVVY